MKSISTILLVIFITLKLSCVIDWSWFWVLAPLWWQFVFWFFIFVIYTSTSYDKKGKK